MCQLLSSLGSLAEVKYKVCPLHGLTTYTTGNCPVFKPKKLTGLSLCRRPNSSPKTILTDDFTVAHSNVFGL